MVYKALIDIDKYKKGDIVPDEIAVVWEKMYKVSPVQKQEEKQPVVVEKVEEAPKEEEESKGFFKKKKSKK